MIVFGRAVDRRAADAIATSVASAAFGADIPVIAGIAFRTRSDGLTDAVQAFITIAAGRAIRLITVIGTTTRPVAGVLIDALRTRIAAVRTGSRVVVLACASQTTVGGVALGAGPTSARRAVRLITVIGTTTRAVASVVRQAFDPLVTARIAGSRIVVLAGASQTTVWIVTLGVSATSAGRTVGDRREVVAVSISTVGIARSSVALVALA